jgi:hypothetical protein
VKVVIGSGHVQPVRANWWCTEYGPAIDIAVSGAEHVRYRNDSGHYPTAVIGGTVGIRIVPEDYQNYVIIGSFEGTGERAVTGTLFRLVASREILSNGQMEVGMGI